VSGLGGDFRLGTATINRGGEVRLEKAAEVDRPAVSEWTRWVGSRSVDHVRQGYERAFRRVLPLASRVLEAMPRRLRAPLLNATRFLRR
jgi:hypothetical protein